MSKLKDKLKESTILFMASVPQASAQAISTPEQTQHKEPIENVAQQPQQSIVASNDKSELNVVYDQGYDQNTDAYLLDGGSDCVFMYPQSVSTMKDNHQEYLDKLKDLFSQPTTQEILAREDMDIDKDRKDKIAAYYSTENNHIVIAEDVFLAAGKATRQRMEDKDIIDCSKMSEDEIAQVEMAYQTIYLTSIISHEKKHRDNNKMGCNEDNILPEFMAKLNMMDEVSANLTQAALALNNYRTTGRTEGFDLLYCCGNEAIDNIKKYVTDPQNKDKLTSEETKKFITEQVRDSWLSKNNNYQEYAQLLSEKILQDFAKYEQSGNEADLQYAKYMCGGGYVDKGKDKALEFFEQYKELRQESQTDLTDLQKSISNHLITNGLNGYSNQAYDASWKARSKVNTECDPLSWLDENSSRQEYETRVNRMFSDIPGMGDVSNYVNPNFELNTALKEQITKESGQNKTPEMKAFFENAANGADNPIDAAKNIFTALEPIKKITEKANADGTVTPEEQQKIDAVTRETINRINSLRGTNKPNETAQSTETTQPTQTNTLPPFLASKGQNTL